MKEPRLKDNGPAKVVYNQVVKVEFKKGFGLRAAEKLAKQAEYDPLQAQQSLICLFLTTQFMPLDDLMTKSCYNHLKRLAIGV